MSLAFHSSHVRARPLRKILSSRGIQMVSSQNEISYSDEHLDSVAGVFGAKAHRFAVAPMMDLTHKHMRTMWRLGSQHSVLYTEMVTSPAMLSCARTQYAEELSSYLPNIEIPKSTIPVESVNKKKNSKKNQKAKNSPVIPEISADERAKLKAQKRRVMAESYRIAHDKLSDHRLQEISNNVHDTLSGLQVSLPFEDPVVLQIGGSCPHETFAACDIAKRLGYKEVNLNVGCPSTRVASAGCFGAALMLDPERVSEVIRAGSEAFGRQLTVKCRIGIENEDYDYDRLYKFIDYVSSTAGVTHFVMHARKAVLGGLLSPEENREIPPLQYEVVRRIRKDFPHLFITVNGGIKNMEQAKEFFRDPYAPHGVMVGRTADSNPFHWLASVDSELYGVPLTNRHPMAGFSTCGTPVWMSNPLDPSNGAWNTDTPAWHEEWYADTPGMVQLLELITKTRESALQVAAAALNESVENVLQKERDELLRNRGLHRDDLFMGYARHILLEHQKSPATFSQRTLPFVIRPLMNLYAGQPNSRVFRRVVSEVARVRTVQPLQFLESAILALRTPSS